MKESFDTEEAADKRCQEISEQRLTRVIHRYPEDGKFVVDYESKKTVPMNKEKLLAKLAEISTNGDKEAAHAGADEALLDFINDPEIREAYDKIDKWYA